MITKSAKRNIFSPKSFMFVFFILALLILAYSIIEFNQSKIELIHLMEEQAHSLLESTLSASTISLLSYETIDKEMKSRLINNANLIKVLYEKNQISNALLAEISENNHINRINIIGKNGKKIYTSHTRIHTDLEGKFSPQDFLQPIFNGMTDTLYLGVREARFEDGFRFAVAISSKERDAIVLNLDAKEILSYRKNIGFGALLRQLNTNKGITYAALQDTFGIIAASGETNYLGQINDDVYLIKALSDSNFNTRIVKGDSLNIFEAVHPLIYKDEVVGLLRLGLPGTALKEITAQNKRRILIMGFILFALGAILFSYVFIKQNYKSLKKDYQIIENYSQSVIQNVSDSVVVVDENNKFKTFNRAAEELFNTTHENIIGKELNMLFESSIIESINSTNSNLEQVEIKINNKKKILLISKSKFNVDEEIENTVLVIRDITKQRILEEQINRKERLMAMGELASGVAHEIRNPLNTISTITQQLNKDFEPEHDKDEYHLLANLVNKEVNRINKTVKDFLRFSKPEKISPNEFRLSELIDQIDHQYQKMLAEKSIRLIINTGWDGIVNWDYKQIQQVIMNLIQNSFDAIVSDGTIEISSSMENNIVNIIIRDNGPGVPRHLNNKIFNLYYTTKAAGTGIGLSIVQKIIYEHNGTIEFESSKNNGTEFNISLSTNPFIG